MSFELSDLNLSGVELKFVGELCSRGVNHPVEAYQASGLPTANLTPTQIKAEALKLMATDRVRTAIKRYISSTLDPLRERVEVDLIEFWGNRMNWSIRDIYNDDGTVKPLNQLPEYALRCIDSIEVDYRGKDATQRIVSYKMASRSEAAKALNEWKNRLVVNKDELPEQTKERIKTLLSQGMSAVKNGGHKTILKRVTETIETDNEEEKDGES